MNPSWPNFHLVHKLLSVFIFSSTTLLGKVSCFDPEFYVQIQINDKPSRTKEVELQIDIIGPMSPLVSPKDFQECCREQWTKLSS
jgi:hypothetical protein